MKTDVLIVGGGLSGLTLAAVLGRAGVNVACLDRDPPAHQLTAKYDSRATAISYATKRVMEAAGAWEEIEPWCAPILDIRVADGASPLFLHFSHDHGGAGRPFGWNLENLPLRKALYDNARRLKKNVRHLAPAEIREFFREGESVGVILTDGTRLSAPLMVGADGRNSAVRGWLNIGVETKDYCQTAIVCTMAHEKDHECVATEHFFPEGPFALLPLPDGADGTHRSSVIWSVEGKRAPAVLNLSAHDFDAELQRLSGPHLGRVRCVSIPRGYPLQLMHAERYAGERVALLAEAAHAIHPIAGQGLNLGMRDVALLAEQITDHLRLGLDIGSPALLRNYGEMRRTDTLIMAGFTDILNKLFSNNLKSAAVFRDLGLGIVEKTPFLKRFFARQAMGLGGLKTRIVQNGRL